MCARYETKGEPETCVLHAVRCGFSLVAQWQCYSHGLRVLPPQLYTVLYSGRSLGTKVVSDCHGDSYVIIFEYSLFLGAQLTAKWRSPEHPSSCTTRKHTQFKLNDRTVQLFAKGTSRAVL